LVNDRERILQVCVNEHNDLADSVVETRGGRDLMTEIPREVHNTYASIGR
jgi:hypothetical protein